MIDQEELESDWVHSVFEVFREEVIAIAADFGDRVKGEIDQIAASQGVRPPSTVSLLTAVAIESSNVAVSLLQRRPSEEADDENAALDDDGENADLGAEAPSDGEESD